MLSLGQNGTSLSSENLCRLAGPLGTKSQGAPSLAPRGARGARGAGSEGTSPPPAFPFSPSSPRLCLPEGSPLAQGHSGFIKTRELQPAVLGEG